MKTHVKKSYIFRVTTACYEPSEIWEEGWFVATYEVLFVTPGTDNSSQQLGPIWSKAILGVPYHILGIRPYKSYLENILDVKRFHLDVIAHQENNALRTE